jgi:ParB family chromosome partitioning protein
MAGHDDERECFQDCKGREAMSEEARRRGLGRGLSALFQDDVPAPPPLTPERQVRIVPVGLLRPGRYQPRRRFDDESLQPLIESIREKGVLQPILVRPHPAEENHYEIVAGERRWRAAQRLRLHEVPIIVREIADREALELGLVENIQRADLTPLEEAEGYRRLIDEFGHTQEALAKAVGKSRSHIANMLRLLALPETVKAMLHDGRLSAGHARALIAAADPAALAEEVAGRNLSVRDAERLAQQKRAPGRRGGGAKPAKDADTLALERELAAALGLKVTIEHGTGGGTLSIHYRTLDQLDDVLRRLNP